MRSSSFAAAVGTLLLAALGSGCGQTPPSLPTQRVSVGSKELVIPDLTGLRSELLGKTPDEVRARLGEPKSTASASMPAPESDLTPAEVEAFLSRVESEEWEFDDYIVLFNEPGVVMQVGYGDATLNEIEAALRGQKATEAEKAFGPPQHKRRRNVHVTNLPPKVIWYYDGFAVIMGDDEIISSISSSGPPLD
jgi:hypothetical protein